MIEDIYFQDEGQVRITAASVGISKIRWTSVKQEEIDEGRHLELMKKNRFDHLPIEPTQGPITEFLKTSEPNNFKNIERHKIKYEDIIPLDTSIREVIERFANSNRTFFFLRYQKNISGLITLGNLNCKQVQVYLFSLICDLERELGEFLNSNLENQEIRDWVESMSYSSEYKAKYKKMLRTYDDLVNLDLENQLTEHFFLLDFFSIFMEKQMYVKFDYKLEEWDDLNTINDLRNRVAHPTKSLLDKKNDIHNLQKQIYRIEDLLFRLNTYRLNKRAQESL